MKKMKHVDNSKKKIKQNKQRHTNKTTKTMEHNTDSINYEMIHMYSNAHTRKHMHPKTNRPAYT